MVIQVICSSNPVEAARKILNVPAALPLYFTATALAKLAHQADEARGTMKVIIYYGLSI